MSAKNIKMGGKRNGRKMKRAGKLQKRAENEIHPKIFKNTPKIRYTPIIK